VTPFRFTARLFRPEGVGTWTFAMVPAAESKRAALRSHQRVRGTIDGRPFRSSLMPRGKGQLFVVVPKAVREAIEKSAGDTVRFELVLDATPVRIVLPPEFATALRAAPSLRTKFEKLAPSHRKAFAQWIGSAVQPETRTRRVEKALVLLRRGETLN
jgi:hypothetical protein